MPRPAACSAATVMALSGHHGRARSRFLAACGLCGVGILGRSFWATAAIAAPAQSQQGKTVYFIRHGTAVHNVRFKQKDVVFRDLIDQRSKTKADRENRWLFPEIEEWAYMTNETVDTSLVEAGVREARLLGAAWARDEAFLHDRGGKTALRMPLAMPAVELIVTSPLTRTLQTTLNVFFQKRTASDCDGAVADLEEFIPRWLPPDADAAQNKCYREPGGTAAGPDIVALDLVKEWSQGRHTPNRRKNASELKLAYPQVSFEALDSEEDIMWQTHWPGAEDGLEPLAHLEARVAKFKRWLAARPERNIVVVSHGTFLGSLLFGTFIEDTVELAHCQLYAGTV